MYFFILTSFVSVFFLIFYVVYIGRNKTPFSKHFGEELNEQELASRDECVNNLLDIIGNRGNISKWSFIHEKVEFEDPTTWIRGKDELKGMIAATMKLLKFQDLIVHQKIFQRDQAFVFLTTKWKVFGLFPIEYKLRMIIFFSGINRIQVIRYVDDWNGEYSNQNPDLNFANRVLIRIGKRFLGMITAYSQINPLEIYV